MSLGSGRLERVDQFKGRSTSALLNCPDWNLFQCEARVALVPRQSDKWMWSTSSAHRHLKKSSSEPFRPAYPRRRGQWWGYSELADEWQGSLHLICGTILPVDICCASPTAACKGHQGSLTGAGWNGKANRTSGSQSLCASSSKPKSIKFAQVIITKRDAIGQFGEISLLCRAVGRMTAGMQS